MRCLRVRRWCDERWRSIIYGRVLERVIMAALLRSTARVRARVAVQQQLACMTGQRRWHLGHGHGHGHGVTSGEGVSKVGFFADVMLASGKAVAGYLSGSTAIVADAAHSVSDVVLSGVAWWSFKAARVPKDDGHPYGHGKYETLGALSISGMLIATGGGIAWHALEVLQGLFLSSTKLDIHSMIHLDGYDHGHAGEVGTFHGNGSNHGQSGHHHGVDLEHPILALNAAIISIGVKEGLYWMTKRAGEREDSGLLKANAWHHRADAVSSVIALIGVGGTLLGMPILDPLAGLLVSGMIVKAGLQNGYQSVAELVDAGAPESVLKPIRKTVLAVEGVKNCHQLRGRKAGSSLHLDVHIEVDPFLSVSAAHNIGETVRQKLHRHHSQAAEIFIHIDPENMQNCPARQEAKKGFGGHKKLVTFGQQEETERSVHHILSSLFSETMNVEHVTCHFLENTVQVDVEISLLTDMLVRDARNIAARAEKEILQSAKEVSSVNILLRLSHQGHDLKEGHDQL